jgi:hypothetical protein
MPLPEPRHRLVLRYAYLWRREADRGREEGSKDRPRVIVLTVTSRDGKAFVTVAPITHAPPRDPARAVEIPPDTQRRLGLDGERWWIVTDEVNRFAWPGPDLRPVSRERPATFAYGLLPRALYNAVRQKAAEHVRARILRIVGRDDPAL